MKALRLALSLILTSTAAHATLEANGRALRAGDTAIAVGAPTVACNGAEHGRLMELRAKALDADFTDTGVVKAETLVIQRANRKHCAFFPAGTLLRVEEAHLDHVCVRAKTDSRRGCLFTHFGRVDPWPTRYIKR